MKLVRIGRSLYALVAVMLLMTVFTWNGSAAEGCGGAVFALTNAPDGNAVVMWSRAADGTLGAPTSYPTGGVGTGAGLGS